MSSHADPVLACTFASCPVCSRKATSRNYSIGASPGEWSCNSCGWRGSVNSNVQWRYRLRFLINYKGQTAEVVTFGAALNDTFGCTAQKWAEWVYNQNSNLNIWHRVKDYFLGEHFSMRLEEDKYKKNLRSNQQYRKKGMFLAFKATSWKRHNPKNILQTIMTTYAKPIAFPTSTECCLGYKSAKSRPNDHYVAADLVYLDSGNNIGIINQNQPVKKSHIKDTRDNIASQNMPSSSTLDQLLPYLKPQGCKNTEISKQIYSNLIPDLQSDPEYPEDEDVYSIQCSFPASFDLIGLTQNEYINRASTTTPSYSNTLMDNILESNNSPNTPMSSLVKSSPISIPGTPVSHRRIVPPSAKKKKYDIPPTPNHLLRPYTPLLARTNKVQARNGPPLNNEDKSKGIFLIPETPMNSFNKRLPRKSSSASPQVIPETPMNAFSVSSSSSRHRSSSPQPTPETPGYTISKVPSTPFHLMSASSSGSNTKNTPESFEDVDNISIPQTPFT